VRLRNPFWPSDIRIFFSIAIWRPSIGVTTKRLNEQVKRNLARFPIEFMFQLTAEEETALRSHFVTSKKASGKSWRATEPALCFHCTGAAMLSSVLSTERAVAVNIEIMRTLVRMRSVLAATSS
jgi:hypothetical protein